MEKKDIPKVFGNPADYVSPVAFRPCLATGLAFSNIYTHSIEKNCQIVKKNLWI
jgi:hypothetical protein